MPDEPNTTDDGTWSLRDILRLHPEWIDLKVVIYRPDGEYDYVGDYRCAGSVYVADEMRDVPGKDCEPTGRKLVVFSPN
jgi:hypothetical protein